MRRQRVANLAEREYQADPPVVISVTVWMDREPEIDSPLPPWLTEAALFRAAELVIEAEYEDPEEEEE